METKVAISTANSVRQLADGTVVCEGHGPDGGTVMLAMGEGSIEIQAVFGEARWKLVLTKAEASIDTISQPRPTMLRSLPDNHNGNGATHTSPKQVVLCPLCGGKRHWKGPSSIPECQWRQWAMDTGKLVDPGNPEYKGNDPEHTAAYEREFKSWLAQQPSDRMYGSVHAERILRQRRRAAVKPNN